MKLLTFDASWEGMLSAVFDAWSLGWHTQLEPGQLELARPDAVRPLFADAEHDVTTDATKAARVWKALSGKMQPSALSALTTSFLSEDAAMDTPTLRFIIKVIASDRPGREADFSDPDMVAVLRTAKRVRYEAHRMLQFVRFQKAADGTYFAMMDPEHNVLPMTLNHFTDRFSDRHFILYDHRRGYGYYYDGTAPRLMSLPPDLNHIATGMLPDEMLDPEERLFRKLWATYFHAIAITERTNPRKQRHDMPVRYWRFLTEKNTL